MKQNLVAVHGVDQAYAAARAAGGMVGNLGGPGRILGRAVGLGDLEMDVGVPAWAWFLMGLASGAVAAYALHERIERVIG